MKTYILEYIVYTRIIDGMLVSERKQKEVRSKTLQGAIKRLYLESEKNFGGYGKRHKIYLPLEE